MRIDVPQFSFEVPEGWGWPLLYAAGALGHALASSVAAGVVQRVQDRSEPVKPTTAVEWPAYVLGQLWPALLVLEFLVGTALVLRYPARWVLVPFAWVARRTAGVR